MLEVVTPQLSTQITRPVDGGSGNEVGEERWVQARVEQRKARGEHAGVGLAVQLPPDYVPQQSK